MRHATARAGIERWQFYRCEGENELVPLLLKHGAKPEKTAVGQSNLLK